MISYPIKPQCRVLGRLISTVSTVCRRGCNAPIAFTNCVFTLLKCFPGGTRLGCNWWAVRWGHPGAPAPLSPSLPWLLHKRFKSPLSLSISTRHKERCRFSHPCCLFPCFMEPSGCPNCPGAWHGSWLLSWHGLHGREAIKG